MRAIFGFLFIVISLLGTIYFRHYTGSIIPYPALWYLFFIVLGFIGAWLVYASFKRVSRIVEQSADSAIEKFKTTAEKIELDFDACEFKSGSYSHEVKDATINTFSSLVPGSTGDIMVTENVTRSCFIYSHPINSQTEKYISQYFPFDETTLRFYVLNHNITLYVDRFDRTKYFFDLKR